MAYELGSIWLQVIPSFAGVQDEGRKAGREAADAYHKGYNERERELRGQKATQAEKTGEEIAEAEAKARASAQRKAAARLAEAERDLQRKLSRLEADSARTRTAERRRHAEELATAAASGDKAVEQAAQRHQQKLADLDRAHATEREKIHARHIDQIAQLEQKGLTDAVAARERAQKALADVEERGLRASERRRRDSFERLRRQLGTQAEANPAAFNEDARRRLGRALEKLPDVKVGADVTEAEAEIRALRRRIEALRDVKINARFDTKTFTAEYVQLMAMIETLDGSHVDIDAEVNAAAAYAELAGLAVASRQAEDGQRGLRRATNESGESAGSAANAFRAMNGVLLAAVTIGPILIPTLLGIAGALGAIATFGLAAAGGIGIGVLGLAGIGDAVGAMGDLENEQQYGGPRAARQARRQTRGADRQVRTAQRGVDSARQQAADGMAGALERQERAERSLARAQEQAQRAQESLTRARQQARREIEDLNNALISGTMSERDALYDLEEARYALFRIQQDGSATQRERDRAQLEYDMQAQAYRELQTDNTRLAEDKTAIDAAGGIAGTDTVRNAERGVQDAARGVADAQRAVADAAADRTRAQVDGAQAIADAEDRLREALENQAEVQADLAEGAGALATAQRKVNEAMDALGPAGQAFALFLFGLKPLLDDLRYAAQEGFLPGLQAGLEMIVNTYGEPLLDFVGRFATALGEQATAFGEWMVTPEVQEFFSTFGDYMLIFLEQFGEIMPNLATGILGVITALLPFTEQFGEALIVLSGAFAEWATSEEGQAAMAAFFAYLAEVSPEVWEMFAEMVLALVNALIALAPWAQVLVEDILTPFFTYVAEMDSDQLGRIILSVIALTVAFQGFAFVIGFLTTGIQFLANLKWLGGSFGKLLGLFGIGKAAAGAAGGGAAAAGGGKAAASAIMRFGPIGLIIGGVLLGLYLLYEHVEPFRNFVDGLVGAIVNAWTVYIWPVFQAIFAWLTDFLGPVFEGFSMLVGQAWEWIVFSAELAWTILEVIFKTLYSIVLAAGAIFTWLYEHAIGPAMGWIGDKISGVYNEHIAPILEALGDIIETHVAPKFQAGVELLGSIWDGLKKVFAMPIDFLVNTVLNRGIIDTLNHVFEFFNLDPVEHVNLPPSVQEVVDSPWPWQFATGGILPGYTPGRDVYDFIDPSSGQRLRLGGGEAIMRPEVTRALGSSTINALNGAAMSGGVSGVRQVLGGSAPHGAVPEWLTNAGSAISSGVRSAVDWVGDTASAAWDFVTDPVGSLKRVVRDIVGGLSDFSEDSVVGRLAVGAPMGLIDKIGSSLSNLLGGATASKHMSAPVPKTAGGRIYGAQPHVDSAASLLSSWVGGIDLMQAFNQSMAGDHPQGLAVDFIDDASTLNRLAEYAQRNAELLGLRYMAWQGRIFTPGGGWAPQTVGYGNDPMHRWHVHISHYPRPSGAAEPSPYQQIGGRAPELRDGGGIIEPGLNYILNATGEQEYALTRQQLDNLRGGTLGGGQTIIDVDIDRPGATAGEIAEEFNYSIRRARRGGAYAGV